MRMDVETISTKISLNKERVVDKIIKNGVQKGQGWMDKKVKQF